MKCSKCQKIAKGYCKYQFANNFYLDKIGNTAETEQQSGSRGESLKACKKVSNYCFNQNGQNPRQSSKLQLED